MLAFMKVLQPKTVEEAYELATKNKTAPMLAGGCWLRLGRRTWPSVIDMASLDLRYVREEAQLCLVDFIVFLFFYLLNTDFSPKFQLLLGGMVDVHNDQYG